MCVSLAGVVLEKDGARVEVQLESRRMWVNALLMPELEVGDHVLIHGGLVLSVITERDARELHELKRGEKP